MLNEQEKEALERSDIIIEGNTATWDLRLDGLINGTYMGAFRFKCYLSPLEQIAASREYREILGPNPFAAEQHETFLAYALTQLKYRIIASPPFWTSANPAKLSGDIPDENIISAVLDASLGAEMKYKSQLKKKKLEAVVRGKASVQKAMTDGDEEEEDESESEESEG